MSLPDLESLTPGLFTACDQGTGDTVTITPQGAQPITMKVHAVHRDNRLTFGFSSANAQDALIDADASMLPGKPTAAWRVTLPRIPGKVYQPRDVERDDSGLRWVFGLKEVIGG